MTEVRIAFQALDTKYLIIRAVIIDHDDHVFDLAAHPFHYDADLALSLAEAKAIILRLNRRNTAMAAFQTLLGISPQQASLTQPELVNRSRP